MLALQIFHYNTVPVLVILQLLLAILHLLQASIHHSSATKMMGVVTCTKMLGQQIFFVLFCMISKKNVGRGQCCSHFLTKNIIRFGIHNISGNGF